MTTSGDIVQFRAKFYTLKATEADIAMALTMTEDFMDPVVWPSKTDYAAARFYLAAHLLTLQLQQKSTVGGQPSMDLILNQVSFGERRVGYQQRFGMAKRVEYAAPGEAALELTIYGQAYLQLRARNIIPVAVI